MGRLAVAVIVVCALIAIVVGFVRLAPSDPAVWHVPETVDTGTAAVAGVLRVVETGPDGLDRFAARARAAPRTEVLAGSVEAGAMTFVTRSRFWGFPDYTTAWQDGPRLHVFARQRYGRSDFGNNAARVRRWLEGL